MKVLSVKYDEKPVGLATHYHNCHQIIYVETGSVKATVNDKEYMVNKGSIIIISKFEEHSIEVLSNTYKRFSVNIASESSENLKENILISSVLVNRPENFTHVINIQNNEDIFKRCFLNMSNEYKQKPVMYQDILNLNLREILTYIYRFYPNIFSENNKDNSYLIYKIQKYIEANYREDITLETLEKEYHISKFHLSRMFKKTTGYSPIDYLINCRISASKKMLKKSNLMIKEIVDYCNFKDESNFSRTFKRKTGVTPSEYRKIPILD